MPLYEYKCTKCDEVTEVLQKFSDPPRRRCKSCSGKLEKLVSRTSFLLKGGGWYSEGYSGGKPDKSETKADGAESPKADKPKKKKKKASSSGGTAS